MRHKITLPELKKYDITQKVIEALSDTESRTILFSIIRRGKTASVLSTSLHIPLSSVYKKLSDLEYLTLIEVEKYLTSNNVGFGSNPFIVISLLIITPQVQAFL